MKESSLEDVYRKYINELYHYLLQLSGNPQVAEDLVQDTFFKAYEYLESYQNEKVRPWLFRIAHNTYIDWYRKEKRHISTDPQVLEYMNKASGPCPEEQYLNTEKLKSWFDALNLLSEKGRQVVILRNYYNFSYQEISQISLLSVTNVKVTLYRARQKIKEVINHKL